MATLSALFFPSPSITLLTFRSGLAVAIPSLAEARPPTEELAAQVLSHLDQNNDGILSLDEFRIYLREVMKVILEVELVHGDHGTAASVRSLHSPDKRFHILSLSCLSLVFHLHSKSVPAAIHPSSPTPTVVEAQGPTLPSSSPSTLTLSTRTTSRTCKTCLHATRTVW